MLLVFTAASFCTAEMCMSCFRSTFMLRKKMRRSGHVWLYDYPMFNQHHEVQKKMLPKCPIQKDVPSLLVCRGNFCSYCNEYSKLKKIGYLWNSSTWNLTRSYFYRLVTKDLVKIFWPDSAQLPYIHCAQTF